VRAALFAFLFLFAGCTIAGPIPPTLLNGESAARQQRRADYEARKQALDGRAQHLDAMISAARARTAHLQGSMDPSDQAQLNATQSEINSLEAQKAALNAERVSLEADQP